MFDNVNIFMNICGLNFFNGEKGRRVEKQLKEIKKIFYQIIK